METKCRSMPLLFPPKRLENLSIHVWDSLGAPMENVPQIVLAGVAQLIGLPPVHVASSIPSRVSCLGLGSRSPGIVLLSKQCFSLPFPFFSP